MGLALSGRFLGGSDSFVRTDLTPDRRGRGRRSPPGQRLLEHRRGRLRLYRRVFHRGVAPDDGSLLGKPREHLSHGGVGRRRRRRPRARKAGIRRMFNDVHGEVLDGVEVLRGMELFCRRRRRRRPLPDASGPPRRPGALSAQREADLRRWPSSPQPRPELHRGIRRGSLRGSILRPFLRGALLRHALLVPPGQQPRRRGPSWVCPLTRSLAVFASSRRDPLGRRDGGDAIDGLAPPAGFFAG